MYRNAPIDIASFHRNYKVCAMGECKGLCCNGGSGFYMPEEADTIREVTTKHRDFFDKHLAPLADEIFSEEKDEETGEITLATNTRDITYPEGMLPGHWPSTACVFKREDGACSLQVLGAEQGNGGWWYKPFACWMFPLEMEHDGKPHIHVAHHSTDEYIDDEYAGFTGYTKCGAECMSGGKPAYMVLENEIAVLSKMLDRDLLSEILAYKKNAS